MSLVDSFIRNYLRMKILILIIIAFLIICCTNLEFQIYKTAHFKIFYTKIDDKNIKEISDSLVYCLNDIIKINFLQLLDTMKQVLLSHSWYGTARQSGNPRCSCQIPKQRVLCEGYQYRQCVLKGIAWS
jgi:hypothetical protein